MIILKPSFLAQNLYKLAPKKSLKASQRNIDNNIIAYMAAVQNTGNGVVIPVQQALGNIQAVPASMRVNQLANNKLFSKSDSLNSNIIFYSSYIKEEITLSLCNNSYKAQAYGDYNYLPSIIGIANINNFLTRPSSQAQTDSQSEGNQARLAGRSRLACRINALAFSRVNRYSNEIVNTVDLITNLLDIMV
ncbi:MAG: hypothetical protein K0R02_751 [Rickettsiaceae bacterium]|jgi:hypothetical protein|nr:hypothetical protein [Rickettsiaceae bacterium]